jgi:HD-like signal output (HDOD) protein/CheY-like chemotaxis protein
MEVMFVDDEPAVLEGIQNRFRKLRGQWDMSFVVGGAEAIAQLGRHPVDVVVTDMRMPGVDGAEVLRFLHANQPRTTRIVLSGYSEKENVVTTMNLAHQFLRKPCDAEELKRAIDRSMLLQKRLRQPELADTLGRIEHFPPLPQLYHQLLEVIGKETCTPEAIARIIGRDPALTARVLRVANSAYWGLSEPICSVPQAVMYLGFEAIRSLVINLELARTCSPRLPRHFSLEKFQQHADQVSLVAAQIAPSSMRGSVMSGAILHDVGHLVLALLPASEQPNLTTEVVPHAELAAHVLDCWGIPPALVSLVAFHHSPSAIDVAPGPTTYVHLADRIVYSAEAGIGPTEDKKELEQLGFDLVSYALVEAAPVQLAWRMQLEGRSNGTRSLGAH